MIYFITLTLAALALIVMAVIVLRHWKEIRLLDPDTIKEERERQKREELLLQRFERMRAEKMGPLKAVSTRVLTSAKKAYHEVYLRLVRLEKYYKQAKAPFAMMAPSVKDRMKLLLDEARSLARDLKWAEAERRYLEALNIDGRNLDAYKGLGTIYLKQKLYPQATETFEFLVKMKKADDTCFAALADIAEAEGDNLKEEEMRKKAVEFRPRLANRQVELAELYIRLKDYSKAWACANRATELDPKSAKYLELSLEAAILVRDRTEAKLRYDKLRLLSEDRPRLQSLKERIDAIEERRAPHVDRRKSAS